MSNDNYFEIEGEAITICQTGYRSTTVTVFKPTPDTVKRLTELAPLQYIGPMRFIDRFDDGEKDSHISEAHYHMVQVITEPRKSNAIILTTVTR